MYNTYCTEYTFDFCIDLLTVRGAHRGVRTYFVLPVYYSSKSSVVRITTNLIPDIIAYLLYQALSTRFKRECCPCQVSRWWEEI